VRTNDDAVEDDVDDDHAKAEAEGWTANLPTTTAATKREDETGLSWNDDGRCRCHCHCAKLLYLTAAAGLELGWLHMVDTVPFGSSLLCWRQQRKISLAM